MHAPDSASPGVDANCVTGRALVAGGAGVVWVMFPVADVLRSYSGSSGSIVSKRGFEELMVPKEALWKPRVA